MSDYNMWNIESLIGQTRPIYYYQGKWGDSGDSPKGPRFNSDEDYNDYSCINQWMDVSSDSRCWRD